MGMLEGRVAIVTGAGSGIGREHARRLAAEGASVVACDLRGSANVATEIRAGGRPAIGMDANCAVWAEAEAVVAAAVDTFGALHILVNNAGVGGGRMFVEMSEADWEASITGNLRTAVAPTRAAVGYWRTEAQAGRPVKASVISTSSGAGLIGNVGQSHYGAAKAAVAAMTVIVAKELEGLGVRLNAVAPAARTPMSSGNPVVVEMMRAPDDPDAFDAWHPREVSPLVAYLASEACPWSGKVFHARGGLIACFQGWSLGPSLTSDRPWTTADIAERLPAVVAEAERLAAQSAPPNDEMRRRLAESVLARAAAAGPAKQ